MVHSYYISLPFLLVELLQVQQNQIFGRSIIRGELWWHRKSRDIRGGGGRFNICILHSFASECSFYSFNEFDCDAYDKFTKLLN